MYGNRGLFELSLVAHDVLASEVRCRYLESQFEKKSANFIIGRIDGMKLPNASRASVDLAKLRDYSLDVAHKEGKHKARVFAAALGLTRNDADWLRERLLAAALIHDCQLGKKTEHGQRYVLDFTLNHGGKSALLRSVWNIRPAEDFPRLITCFVQ